VKRPTGVLFLFFDRGEGVFAMYTGTLRRLAGVAIGVVSMAALVFSPTAFSEEPISSLQALGKVLENAVMCKTSELDVFSGSEFDGGPDDPKRQLETLGVKVATESRHGGETVYHFPPGVKVFGYEASDALFYSESTTLFFVNLRSRSDKLHGINKILKLEPIKNGNSNGYGYFNEFDVRDIRKLSGGGDGQPYAIFSGIGNRDGRDYIVIGCQNLSW
jgi:hypothetical protein